MDLIMANSEEKGTFYFTSYAKAAIFFGVHYNAIRNSCYGTCRVKGFTCKWIKSEKVLSSQIDKSREEYVHLFGDDNITKKVRSKRGFVMNGYAFEGENLLIVLTSDNCIITPKNEIDENDSLAIGLFNNLGLSDESLSRISHKLECLGCDGKMIRWFMNVVLDLYASCYDYNTKQIDNHKFLQNLEKEEYKLSELEIIFQYLVAKIN